MAIDKWGTLTRNQQKEVKGLLEKLGTDNMELGLTIRSIAHMVKAVEEIAVLLGQELPDAIEKIKSAREQIDVHRVMGFVNRTRVFLERQIPQKVSALKLPFLPSDKALEWLDEADRGLGKAVRILDEAHFNFKDIPAKVRPLIRRKAGKTRNKWELFVEKEHHVDLAATYIDQLVRVHGLPIAKSGARLLYAIGYRCKNPWCETKVAERNFRKNALDGQKYLKFLDL